MVRRFVHHQAPRAVLVPMPPPEIVCAVYGIQEPLKVDRFDIANLATRNELFDFPVCRVVTVVEQDLAGPVGTLDGVEDLATLVHIPTVSCIRGRTYVAMGFSVSTLIPFSSAGMMYWSCV